MDSKQPKILIKSRPACKFHIWMKKSAKPKVKDFRPTFVNSKMNSRILGKKPIG